MGKHPEGEEELAGRDAVRDRERGFYEKVEEEQDLDFEEAAREVEQLGRQGPRREEPGRGPD